MQWRCFLNKLNVNIGGLELKNPLLLASGVWDTDSPVEIEVYGAVILKGVNLNGRKGNPPPRIYDIQCGVINSIGLENGGVDELNRKIEKIKGRTKLIANIFGSTIEEYKDVAERLKGIDGIEINVSCPNVKDSGIAFGRSPEYVERIAALVKKVSNVPVFVKLTPDTDRLEDIALAAEKAGADAVVCANTYTGMAIDINTGKPILGGTTGGVSGPCIKPLTVYRVWKLRRVLKIPIIASGGIASWQDVIEYIMAGADAVEIGSIIFRNLDAGTEIISGLNKYLEEKNIHHILDIRGGVHDG